MTCRMCDGERALCDSCYTRMLRAFERKAWDGEDETEPARADGHGPSGVRRMAEVPEPGDSGLSARCADGGDRAPEGESREPSRTQVGGDHYARLRVQPVDYMLANGLGYCEGNVVKYVSRWKSKGGVEDLKKARQYLDFLIDWVGRQ